MQLRDRYIDLGVDKLITRVKVYWSTAGGCTSVTSNVEIRVGVNSMTSATPPSASGNALCWSSGGASQGSSTDAACTSVVGGRYVSVQLTGAATQMQLCEVEIYGC